MKEKIIKKLEQNLDCIKIDISDVSHLHEGHGGWKEGGETHFNLVVVSNDFDQKSRLLRHKIVLETLKDYMDSPIHALSMKLYSLSEYQELKMNSKK